MNIFWITLAILGIAATVPLWRLAVALTFKVLGTLVLWAAASAFLLSSPVFASKITENFSHLLLASCAIACGVSAYFLARAWASDRAEISRLRAIAQRNAEQISVVSHEIRTPLALVQGAADLLHEESPGPLTQAQRRFVQTISGNCASVVALAEDLLVQARIDAGIFKLHLQRVNLRALITSVVSELRSLHSVDLALDCPGAPPRLWADARLLRQALTNLVNNAVAHAHQATLVTVRVVNADAQILVSVTDDGTGISDAARRQLFERFASGRPLRDGTGLGLVITRQIIQMHGGEVLVNSTPQRGTTMLFSLPTNTPVLVQDKA